MKKLVRFSIYLSVFLMGYMYCWYNDSRLPAKSRANEAGIKHSLRVLKDNGWTPEGSMEEFARLAGDRFLLVNLNDFRTDGAKSIVVVGKIAVATSSESLPNEMRLISDEQGVKSEKVLPVSRRLLPPIPLKNIKGDFIAVDKQFGYVLYKSVTDDGLPALVALDLVH